MRVQEETIEKIRTSLDIVEIIGEYVQLKKQGRNYFAVCPFHNEHTPSFSVSPDKQIFHCFGCGVGGNIYTFIMEIEGLPFIETVQFLADKANITVDGLDSVPGDGGKKQKGQELTLTGLELLTKFYHYLLTDHRYGIESADYLQKRGFTKESIEKFQLGYSVKSWDAAVKFLQKREVPLQHMEKVGMVSQRHFDQKYFDRFRERIMFPIWNHRGQTVAFAGRVLTDEKPKYLNTPESDLFHKGKILYGYHLARSAIKQHNTVVLFEGYMDVIKAHQAGIIYSVASMGTSLTEEQAGLLTRNAETIIICYDSDRAGIEAAFRAANLLTDSGRTVKIARVPNGMDPDDYITKFGNESFQNDVLGASQTFMAFKLQYLKNGKNLQDEGDRLRYIEEVLKEIAGLKKAVERDHYLRQLANDFSLSLDALKQQQYQLFRQLARKEERQVQRRLTKLPNKAGLYPAYMTAERHLLAHMFRDAELSFHVQSTIGGAFNLELHQALAAHLYGYYSEGKESSISAFIQQLQDPELQKTATEIAMIEVDEQVSSQVIEDYIKQVMRHSYSQAIEEKEAEKKKAEQNHDDVLAAQLLAEIISMKKEMTGYKRGEI